MLPGSHSKWAIVEGGRVERFKTFVTGELFAAVRDHTLVGAFARAAHGRSRTAQPLRAASSAAPAAARGDRGSGLLGALFGARSLPLMGELAEDDAAEYLSGLLIGAEIAEARRLFPREARAWREPTRWWSVILPRSPFSARKRVAAPSGAAARGLLVLARQAGLLS